MTIQDSQNNPSSQSPMQPVYLVQSNNNTRVDDEIDLRELWETLWQGKLQIAGITAVFAIASVIIALMLPNIYRS